MQDFKEEPTMDRNAKRQILKRKSVYKRKWMLLDEIQFQMIMLKLRKDGIVKQSNLRANVKIALEKYGKNVESIDKTVWEIF